MLFDRERVIREIDALVAEARAREQPAIVRIAGPAGIGKSALLRHLADRERPRGEILYAAAMADEHLQPGALARRIGVASDGSSRTKLAAAVAGAFATMRLVCIDDLQWVDELSARAVRRAVRRAPPNIVILLADRREEADEALYRNTVHLAPLRRAAASAIVRRIYPNAEDAVVLEIIEAADGNPFTIEALARAAGSGGARAAGDVEPSLEAAMASRMRRSTERGRQLVRYAALIGVPDTRLIAAAARMPIEDVASELGMFPDLVEVDGDRLVFRHVMLAEAIAKTINEPAAFHREILDACETSDDRIAGLAVALRAALGCRDRAAAAPLALRLARLLAAEGALSSAASHARLAIDLAPHPTPPEYAVEYAGILQARARDHEAASFLRTALGTAIERGDAAAAAALIGAFAASAIALERPEEVEVYGARIAAIPGVDEPMLRKVRSARYNVAAFSGSPEPLLELDPSSARWPDHRALAHAAALAGDRERSRLALQHYRAGLGPRFARVTGADRALEAAIGLFERGGAALEEHGTEISGSFDSRGGYSTIAALHLVRCTAAGRWVEADRIVAALEDDEDEPYPALDARLMYQAVARKSLSEPDRTLRTVRALVAQGRKRHAIAAASWLWLILTRSHEPVPADIRDFVTAELRTRPMPYLFGGIPLAVAWLAPWLGADASVSAIRWWSPYTSRWHAAHRALALGVATSDRSELRNARDAFDVLAAPVFGAIAGTLLPIPRAGDVALAARLGLGSADDAESLEELSPRERDVAEMAAQDQSNREIASALRISERTVEVHITSILRKLGLRSRAGIAGKLHGW
jgi:DNA-binding CsgD family transcriptional regulator